MNSNTFSLLTNAIDIKEGEYLPAYISRLLSYGTFIKPREFFSLFESGIPHTSEGYLPSWASKLANSGKLDISMDDLIDNHLGGKFWRSFVNNEDYQSFVNKQLYGEGTNRVLFPEEKPLTKYAPLKYCQRCRDEEIKQFGFPIWKSRNQLTTVFTCSIHGDVLHQKFQRSPPIPDGKSADAFLQVDGYQPKLTTFHRWLEFETNMVMSGGRQASHELLSTYRSVFLESSFYKKKGTENDCRLRIQWSQALECYLRVLFPLNRDELWYRIKTGNASVTAIIDCEKRVHPLFLLLFKTFYMFQYKA